MSIQDAAARARKGLELLSQGDYRQGWSLYEARFEVGRAGMAKPSLPFPEWKGEDVSGKRFLIWPEQGFGDQIQFARFAQVMRGRGASVTLICYPPLLRLFRQLAGIQVLAAEGRVEFPDPDYWAMAGSLPRWLAPTLEDIPASPYLKARTGTGRANRGPRIGVITRGSGAHSNDAHRSLDSASALRLIDVLGEAISLDPMSTGAKDFADTAQIIGGLDLVVTVDTSVAHLAGALGKPCWVMLPHVGTDWRWMRERSDSPWYPSIRLFRQAKAQEWGPVIQEIERELRLNFPSSA